MISYKPFFETLLRKNITEYELIFKHGISANTIHRMKKGEAITTKTLDVLCYILDCPVSDIIEHDKTKWAGGLFCPYKGLLPALGLKTRWKLASRNIISLQSPKGLILFALFYWLTRKRVNILF